MQKIIIRHRSSVTGRFVSELCAKLFPWFTVREEDIKIGGSA
jgi:hypothetical protein